MQKKYLKSKNKNADYICISEKIFFNEHGTFTKKRITMICDSQGRPLKFEQDAEGRLLNIYPNDK